MSPRTTRARGYGRSSSSMCSARRKSNSTATNGLPVEQSSIVRAPSPGPISRTGSSGSWISAAIRRATRGSLRKFCPRRLLGRTPSSRRTAAIPEVALPLEPEKASRGGVGRVLERARGHPQRRGKLVPDEGQIGRLVSLPPVRHGSEVGSVGLEHDVGKRELANDVGKGALLEGRGSPHPDLEPHGKYPPGE